MTTVAEALALAAAHQNAGRPEEAALWCRRVLETVPDHPDALHLLGVMAHRGGDAAGAREFVARAAARDPARADLQHSLGVALMTVKRYAEAEPALARAAALDPARGEVRFLMGRCRARGGRFRRRRAPLPRRPR